MVKSEAKKLIGNLVSEPKYKARMRFHQGWWRAFVLGEDQGPHPKEAKDLICNTINSGEKNNLNFLSPNIIQSVKATIKERETNNLGLIDTNRLYNNLLSSQPLCFNFFGELKKDEDLRLRVLNRFYPSITKVGKVMFEYAPIERFTGDNSAFDVAFEVFENERRGLIGFECKYTDSFSSTQYDNEKYKAIFQNSNSFIESYENYIKPKFNQLFRNQLIAESLVQNQKYEFVYTGLFCHENDFLARQTALDFQKMLNNGRDQFRAISYRDYISEFQQLNLTWEQRELSMLLWARYSRTCLSESVYSEI